VKVNQNRGVLENNLAPILEELSSNKEAVSIIQEKLISHKVLPGETKKYFNDPEKLYQSDLSFLCLLTELVYGYTKEETIRPSIYFTDQERKDSYQFNANIFRNQPIKFPLELSNFFLIGDEWFGRITAKTIKQLMDSQLLYYNPDVQRELTVKRRRDSIVYMPTLNKKNIEEIANLMETGELEHTDLVFNAAMGSAPDGDEIIYNDRKKTVTIMPGTRLDVVDGFHRCIASQNALAKNSNINFDFILHIINRDTEGAKSYQAQLGKAMPFSVERVQSLEAKTPGDQVVLEYLQKRSDLRGKISQTKKVHAHELTSYPLLVDAINSNFKMDVKADIGKVGNYLNEFFTYLVGIYKKELGTNIIDYKNKTYVSNNLMFAGYIVLAARMFKEGMDANEIENIIVNIDFDKNSPRWKNIIENNKTKTKQNIVSLFESLTI
jgi:hypothetical protein